MGYYSYKTSNASTLGVGGTGTGNEAKVVCLGYNRSRWREVSLAVQEHRGYKRGGKKLAEDESRSRQMKEYRVRGYKRKQE